MKSHRKKVTEIGGDMTGCGGTWSETILCRSTFSAARSRWGNQTGGTGGTGDGTVYEVMY